MPINRVEVNEYECYHCGKKWTNRFDGVDGPIPKTCSRCKKTTWNRAKSDLITGKENGLRQRLKNITKAEGITDIFDKLLNVKPKPTVDELEQILYPLGWDPRHPKNKYLVYDKTRKADYFAPLDYTCRHRPEYYLRRANDIVIPIPPEAKTRTTRKIMYNENNEYEILLQQEKDKRLEFIAETLSLRGLDCSKEVTEILEHRANRRSQRQAEQARYQENMANKSSEQREHDYLAFKEAYKEAFGIDIDQVKKDKHNVKSKAMQKWWNSRKTPIGREKPPNVLSS